MKFLCVGIGVVLMASACSEETIEEQSSEQAEVSEKEIAQEAKSLEEAAEEAAAVVEADIASDLTTDGFDLNNENPAQTEAISSAKR